MSEPALRPSPRHSASSPPAQPLGTWPHALPHEPSLRVSDVLALVQHEFPALTTSKLRFLDAQGLVRPYRTPSGYRQYSPADVERLRYVLRQQRDHYRPLTVIAQLLEDLDRGRAHEPVLPHEVMDDADLLTPAQLAQRAGVEVDFVHELDEHGLLEVELPGRYDPGCAALVAAAWSHVSAGADIREVRALKQAATRMHDQHAARVSTLAARGRGEEAEARMQDLGESALGVLSAYVRHHYGR